MKEIEAKQDGLIEKLEEIAVHVGLFGTYRKGYDIVKALRSSRCKECDKLANELALLKSKRTSQGEETKEVHTTCDGCQMFANCGCMLDDSCPECVEHHLWRPKAYPKEYFGKVYIKSESDLPKEGKYHFHILVDTSLRFKDVESASFRQLKKKVDYYLLPVSEPVSNGNAEEKANKMKEFNPNEDRKFTIHDLNNGHKEPLRIMEEQMGKEEGKGAEELNDLTIIRNKLYDMMPTGEIDAFDLITIIKCHLKELDFYIDHYASLPAKQSVPVTDLKKLVIDLESHRDEYKNMKHQDGDKVCEAIYQGKSEAYWFSASELRKLLKWHGIDL